MHLTNLTQENKNCNSAIAFFPQLSAIKLYPLLIQVLG
ncbi:hypothetical protein SPLC1_S551130 [Arthrospira platensis C1]|nr:hypothetical protein SPLC1_S551130 [Arthrospira platensis C1]